MGKKKLVCKQKKKKKKKEKCLDTIFKNLVNSNSVSNQMCKSENLVGMNKLCKVLKQQVDGSPHFGQFYQLYRLLHISLLGFYFPYYIS